MEIVRTVNLGVRFVLEIAALAAVAYWGATVSAVPVVRAICAILAPLGVAVVWGLFISPRGRFPTGRLGRAALGLVVFLGAAIALFVRGHVLLSEAFAATAIVSSILVYVLPQQRA